MHSRIGRDGLWCAARFLTESAAVAGLRCNARAHAVTSIVAPCSATVGPEAALATCEVLTAFFAGRLPWTAESLLRAIRAAAESLEYLADRAGSVREVIGSVEHYGGAIHVFREADGERSRASVRRRRGS